MLNFLFSYRFRSPQRDKANDQGRLTRIHQSVCSALADAESEFNGLRGRLQSARQSAGLLLGIMDNDDGEEADKLKLRSVEERLLVAERRIVQLKDHLAALRRIESAVNAEIQSVSESRIVAA